MTQATKIPRVGLALGGGGARGLAHIGVLKALEEEHITIDFLAGTSMGGVIAAAYAAGRTPDELIAEGISLAQTPRLLKLLDFSRPRRGLMEGRRVRSYLSELIGAECCLESLRLPTALTAVDLPTGQPVVLREGNLVEAALATMSVPGIFTPVCIQGYELVDGGLLNNVPVDVLRLMGADITIAVDVSPNFQQDAASGNSPGVEWPRFIPGFVKDFYQAEMIMISTLTEINLMESAPEILLHPDVPAGISIFWGFELAAEAIKAGEESVHRLANDIRLIIQG